MPERSEPVAGNFVNSSPQPSPVHQDGTGITCESWDRGDYYWMAGLCLLVSIFYAQLWMPGLVLTKRDAFHTFLPLKQYMMERLAAGELPQWFPYESLGCPLLGIPVTGLFHPFTALYWVVAVPDAYRLSTLLSCLLGAIGTFLLGRTVGLSRFGAFLSAAAFVCSGYVASMTDNISYLYSICALPLFLACIESATTTALGKWIAASAVVWASVILNGDVQTAYYYGFIALFWVILRRKPHRLWAAGLLLSITVLTVFLAGIQLAPAWTIFSGSTRANTDTFYEQSIRWSTHPLRVPTMALSPIGDSGEEHRISRELFGGKDPTERVSGFWAESLYVGLPVIGLALMGMWRPHDLKIFVVLAVLSLVLATGKYGGLYEWLMQVVPLWSAFRYPEKFMGVVSLALAVLAGRGMDRICEGRSTTRWWAAGALLYMALAAFLYSESSASWFGANFHIPGELARHVTGTAAQAALFGSAVLAGSAVLTIWAYHHPVTRQWYGAALIILVMLDLARANLPVVHTSSAEVWNFSPGLVSAIKDDAKARDLAQYRILSMTDQRVQASPKVMQALTPHELVAAVRRQGLTAEHNAVHHIESIQGPLPGKSLLYEQVAAHANLYLLARYNVAYLIGRPSRFEGPRYAASFVAAVPDYDLTLVRNPVPVSPRVYLSRKPITLSHQESLLTVLDRDDFLRGDVDVVEGAPEPLPGPLSDGTATILEYRPESIRIAVETSQQAVLVLGDAFEPGWTARSEGGVELPIYRANGLVRAVVVPPGRSQIIFRYETPLLGLGILLSAIGCGLCGLLMTVKKWRRPQKVGMAC